MPGLSLGSFVDKISKKALNDLLNSTLFAQLTCTTERLKVKSGTINICRSFISDWVGSPGLLV